MMKYLTVVWVSFTRMPGEYFAVTSAATVKVNVSESADAYVQVSPAATQPSVRPAPSAPVGPVGPVAPAVPVEPVGPVPPAAPVLPVGPVAPVVPVLPVGP